MKFRCLTTACLALCVMALSISYLVTQPVQAQTEPVLGEISGEFIEAEPADSGFGRNEALIASLTIFCLAIFVGFEVITKVPPTLHTPLMSGSNAISGITLVGAALVAGSSDAGAAGVLGMLAVALAAVNVVGGFMVTDRMLAMFKKK